MQPLLLSEFCLDQEWFHLDEPQIEIQRSFMKLSAFKAYWGHPSKVVK